MGIEGEETLGCEAEILTGLRDELAGEEDGGDGEGEGEGDLRDDECGAQAQRGAGLGAAAESARRAAAGSMCQERQTGASAVTIMTVKAMRKEKASTSRLSWTSARRGVFSGGEADKQAQGGHGKEDGTEGAGGGEDGGLSQSAGGER